MTVEPESCMELSLFSFTAPEQEKELSNTYQELVSNVYLVVFSFLKRSWYATS